MRTPALGVLALLVLAVGCVGCGPGPSPDPPPSPVSRKRPPLPPGAGDVTRGEFPWPLPLNAAEDILLKTTLFEFGGMPEKRQVYAFNVVFDQPDALERFRRVARLAGPAGRLYALCALQELYPPEAVALGRNLAESADPIIVGNHDVYGEQPVRDVVVLVLVRRLGAEFRQSRVEVERYFKGPGSHAAAPDGGLAANELIPDTEKGRRG